MIIPSTSSSSSRQPRVNLKTSYSTNAMMTNSKNWYAPSNLHVPPLNPNDPFLSKLASAAASFPEAFLNRPVNSDTPPYLDVYDSPTLMASPAQVERSVGYDDAELTTPPPDLPSILLHGRIVYIGMAVKVNDHTYGFLASYVVVALKSLPPSAKTIRDLSIWVFENAKHKNVEHVVILSGDHLYRMNYMDFVQKHIDTKADITVSCIPMDDSRASDYGLMKIDSTGRIIQFAEKPKGPDLKAMKVDTTVLGLSIKEAEHFPYIASMGVYVFRTDVLLKLLKWSYPSSNDFGSEIIPAAVDDHNVQELHH